MRLLVAAGAAIVAALALATSVRAALWIDLGRSAVRPGQVVSGTAVSPCALCGPRRLYLVNQATFGGLELVDRLPPRRGVSRFVPAGRFDWKRGGRFTFEVPRLRSGVYALVAFYRNGSSWTVATASPPLRVRT